MSTQKRVSYTQPLMDAMTEQGKLIGSGYVTVDMYKDIDMGVILEYAHGADRYEVLQRHYAYVQRCADIQKEKKN